MGSGNSSYGSILEVPTKEFQGAKEDHIEESSTPVISDDTPIYIHDLNDAYQAALRLGYQTKKHDEVVVLQVAGFSALLSITKDGRLNVVAEIGQVKSVSDEKIQEFAVAALLKNLEISPFAFGLLDGGDDDSINDDSIVLVNSVPLGNLNQSELDSLLTSLRRAIINSAGLIRSTFSR